MTSLRRRLALIAVLVVSAAATVHACQARGGGPRAWADGSVHGDWRSVYDGYGENTGHDGQLSLSPRPSRRAGETHAGLIVSTAVYADVDCSARLRTLEQLRTPTPNPWEVPWLLWAYSDPEHFYYVTLKPNGWELGKRDPAYPGGQRFLATGPERFPVGRWYRLRVVQRGAAFSVTVDGRALAAFTDAERPYPGGGVGAYTEDARVEFRDMRARRLSSVG